jgi:hypothetical protein
MDKKHTFRFGNSAFFINGKVVTDKEGCLRIVLLRANEAEKEILPQTKKTFALGHVNEEIFIENYVTPLNVKYEKEKEFQKTTKLGTWEVGHSDVIAYGNNNTPVVFELKSVSSVNSHKNYVLGDKLKLDNLAQLVNYMHEAKAPGGYLVYSSYIWGDYYKPKDTSKIEKAFNEGRLITDEFNLNEKGIQIRPADKFYEVTFDTEGYILIDGVKYQDFNKKDVLKHRIAASKVLKEQLVWPERPESLTYHPCTYCPFKNTCLKFDQKVIESTEDFIQSAKDELQNE